MKYHRSPERFVLKMVDEPVGRRSCGFEFFGTSKNSTGSVTFCHDAFTSAEKIVASRRVLNCRFRERSTGLRSGGGDDVGGWSSRRVTYVLKVDRVAVFKSRIADVSTRRTIEGISVLVDKRFKLVDKRYEPGYLF